MTAGSIITFVIFLLVAIFMVGIGIFQMTSVSPVGFYSGEVPPREDQLTDVKAWNRKHGMMWIIYGVIIMISYFAGYLIGDSPLCLIPFLGGLLVPVAVMIMYHHRLIRKYKKK
ncbi:MAG: hypothetical protein ACI4EU_08070 [Butyrivibrio sp.]